MSILGSDICYTDDDIRFIVNCPPERIKRILKDHWKGITEIARDNFLYSKMGFLIPNRSKDYDGLTIDVHYSVTPHFGTVNHPALYEYVRFIDGPSTFEIPIEDKKWAYLFHGINPEKYSIFKQNLRYWLRLNASKTYIFNHIDQIKKYGYIKQY